MDRANAGRRMRSNWSASSRRAEIRACRDNIPSPPARWKYAAATVTSRMVHARLVRDAHIGVLWEAPQHHALDTSSARSGKAARTGFWAPR